MEQSYIFDFCSLFDMEQAKDIERYYKYKGTNNKHYESKRNTTSGANV